MTFKTDVKNPSMDLCTTGQITGQRYFKTSFIATSLVQLNVPIITWSQKFWCQEGGVTCQMSTMLNSRAEI